MKHRVLQSAQSLLSRKKALCGVACIVLLFSFVPFEFAHAGLGTTIGNAIADSVSFVLEKLLALVERILQEFYTLIAKAMVEISEWILGFGVKPGASHTPSFVTAAWGIVLGLVNIFFILILVFIGLATILRLPAYQYQKTLPLLIMMALLINFSGVLVGFIVDMSNLVTLWFLEKATGDWNRGVLIGDLPLTPGDSVVQSLATHIALIIYYFVAILIYFVLLLLFVVRTMFLWALAILAPLAFASYILPATRGKIWNEWWQQLIQWSIFIIPVSFFMWLASTALTFSFSEVDTDESLGEQASWFANLLAPFTSLLLLYLGLTTSQQMAPAAAKEVIGRGKKWGTGAGKALGSAAWRFRGGKFKIPGTKGKEFGFRMEEGVGASIQGAGRWLKQRSTTVDKATRDSMEESINKRVEDKQQALAAINPTSSTPQDIAQRKQLNKDIENLEEERKKLPKADREGISKVGWAVPALLGRWTGKGVELGAGELTMRMKAKDEREIGEGKSEALNKDSADNIIKINQEFAKGTLASMNRIVGLLNGTVANGDSDDLQAALRDGILSGKQVGQALLAAQRGGPASYRPIAKALYGKLLTDSEQFGFSVTERDEKGIPIKYDNADITRMVNEVPEKLTTSDITNKILGDTIDKGKSNGREFIEFGGEMVLKHLVEVRGGDLTSSLIRRPESKVGRAAILNVFQSINPEDLHSQGADGLMTYLASTAAQGAGVVSPLLPNETRSLLELLRNKDRATLSTQDETQLRELINIWTAGVPPAGTAPGGPAAEASPTGGGPSTPTGGFNP